MYDLRDLVPLGISAKVSKVVKESDTATHYSTALQDLLATPACIGLAIEASVEMIDNRLPDGFVSIGRSIEFEHTLSTRLGVKVTMEAIVVDVQPTYILIRLTLWDGMGEIGHGTHKRSIVNREALLDRAKRRAEMMINDREL